VLPRLKLTIVVRRRIRGETLRDMPVGVRAWVVSTTGPPPLAQVPTIPQQHPRNRVPEARVSPVPAPKQVGTAGPRPPMAPGGGESTAARHVHKVSQTSFVGRTLKAEPVKLHRV